MTENVRAGQGTRTAGGGSPDDAAVVISPAFKADAPRQYARLRALGPVHRAVLSSGLECWLVVGYEAAREALTHPALRKDPRPAAATLAAAGYVLNQPGVGLGGQMLEADAPEHTRLRKLVSGAFTPRRTAALAPRVQRIADDLIDALGPAGETDLVASFTAPLPVTVIAELLGIPPEHREDFRRWTSDVLDVTAAGHASSLAGLHGLLGELVAAKRRRPEDDLLSDLVAARDERDGEDRLSEQELIGTATLLVIAGHETTVNLLGNAVHALLRHPEQLRLLRARPQLLPGAVEEFLRYDTSVEHSTLRYAAEDVRLGGRVVPRGGVVAVALSSAGHDAPQADGGDPAALDVARPAARHLSFGHGIHHCLGAPLARLEAVTALGTLLRRLPRLEPAVPLAELAWIPSGMMRGPLSLPVRYEAAPAPR
ncbi:cytochrome P450 [Streptomyces sp. SL13]|uniref:Cytochrome P450 n=1 Tax=Streptantibioticus silvisoli TaxID=2705255 RepID=A0AA90H4S4_9ACTN|nr:cytochrome P450 [Streptantibioticus silvisoli]MDI5971961.1 cytochrome P450 [Streptantibioticus silvisoli]